MYINTIKQSIQKMNISRLLPFLSLLMLLPATSSADTLLPHEQTNLKPGDLCPLINIVEHELCVSVEHANQSHEYEHEHIDLKNASGLCVLLQDYNASFCSSDKFITKPMSLDVMSIHVLENEYNNHSLHEEHEEHAHEENEIHNVCPIINFIEQELCTSRNEELKVHFDPKQLCLLLNLTYTEICE
jgi:hypothetical protein